jgi:beta-glucuronidase
MTIKGKRARRVRTSVLFLLVLTLAAGQASAAPWMPQPALVDADSRAGIDLSGRWHYAAGSSAPRDWRSAPMATLPSSWQTQAPALRHYNGIVWYQRSFTADVPPQTRAFLRFGAVNYLARVYLNGTYLGRHEGGFTPFAFEVTGLLHAGENAVTVSVDSRRTPDSVPPPVVDWDLYGGITRPVRVIFTPKIFIDDEWVRLVKDGRMAASVRLNGADLAARTVTVRIPALDLSLEGQTDSEGRFTAEAVPPAALKLWSPDDPALYDVTITAGADALKDRVGFRTIAVRGTQILLNGKPIFLRGISMHEEEFGADPTRDMTPEAARALLSQAKALHANYVRLTHYPHSEVTVRMADEMGLLVWSEIPVYWHVDFSNPGTLSLARRMLAEEIERDRNRASIIIWSLGNETPPGAARNAFLATLASDARALDDTRLVSAALLARRSDVDGHPQMIIDDPIIPLLDVMAVNTYLGWYSSDPLSSLPAITWTSPFRKPLLFSEFGAGALAGFHDPLRKRKFSEEFQAEYYRKTLAMAANIPFLRGMSPWILKDFRSPLRHDPVYQQGWNRKGLESETGRRKLAFAVLADAYRALARMQKQN